MPFLFSHTLIFEGLGHGFSETMYFEMETASLTAAFNKVAIIKSKRAPLLGKQHYIKGERIALRKTDLGVKVTNRTKVVKFFLPGNQSQNSEETNMSLQVLMTTGDEAHKKLTFMGGPYAAIFPEGDSFAPIPSFTTNFNAWVAALKEAKMGWLTQVAFETRKILGYGFDADTGHTTYTFAAPGFTWPDPDKPARISVEFPLSRSPLDGVQLVVPDDATHATTAKPRPAAPFTVKGTAKLFHLEFVGLGPVGDGNAGTAVAQNPVSRKRGRPLLVSRGRLLNRPLW